MSFGGHQEGCSRQLARTGSGRLLCQEHRHPDSSRRHRRLPSQRRGANGCQLRRIAAFVFNTVVDPQKGQQTFFRTYSGTLKSDSHVYNVNTSTDERLGQLFLIRGKVPGGRS